MTSRTILFDDEALDRIQDGVNKLADAVKVTLGPRGRNVALEKAFGSPNVTKDGVSVAREIDLEDNFENMGAQVIKEAAIRTADRAGDGTTTATVIAQSLFNESRKLVVSGASPIPLKRGMDRALKESVNYLQYLAKPVDSLDEIRWVATISSNGDTALADLIAEAMEKVGKGGVISVEEGSSTSTILEFSEGLQLDRGFLHNEFGRLAPTGEVSLERPVVLLVDGTISSPAEIIPVMEYANAQSAPLFIVCHDLTGDALVVLLQNLPRLPALAVKAPRIGEKRTQLLENMAVLTGGKVVSQAKGLTLGSSTPPEEYLGTVDTVSADRQRTTLLGGGGSDEAIQSHIRTLRAQVELAESPTDQEFLQQCISQLGGGLAVIRVGAQSEVELKEYKARVEDALSATKAAVSSGVVPGGGCTLLEVSGKLREIAAENPDVFTNTEEYQGWMLVARAFEAPYQQILRNAGLSAEVLLNKYREEVKARNTPDLVYNVREEEIQLAFEVGIVDPVLVVEEAMKNSVSVASTLLTTACAIGLDQK